MIKWCLVCHLIVNTLAFNFRYFTMATSAPALSNTRLWLFISVLGSAVICATFYSMYAILYVFNIILRTALFRKEHWNKRRAQFGRILWKRKPHYFDVTSTRDFLCIFSSSVELDYVLKPNVSLYALTKDTAVFVETTGGVNIYSSDDYPFFNQAQFKRSRNVIKMPTISFHALAEKVGDPSVPVIWLSNTARCGSTILAQVFEKIPGTSLISEPDAPTHIGFMHKLKSLSENDRKMLLKSTIRLLCKPRTGIERICVKSKGNCISMMKDVSNIFPDIKQIFMYRNCRETVASHLALLSAVPYSEVARICFDSKWLSFVKPFIRKDAELVFIRRLTEEESNNYDNTVEMFTYMWANYMLVARDAMSRDTRILPVKYEDLMSEKNKTCKMIFENLGLDVASLNTALAAFGRDSQRGTVLSCSRIGNVSRRMISDQDRIKADVILSRFNLPHMGDDFRIWILSGS